jgi:hypothetical protein
MISVLILGQPYWAVRIARALNSNGPDVRAVFIPQSRYARLLAAPPRSEPLVLMRAGYRVGATTVRGRLFDAYWSLLRRSLPHAVSCHYWLGSDVLDTMNEANAGTLRWAALSSVRHDLHLADAPWLTSELEAVGLQAVTAHVPQSHHVPSEIPPLPSEFRVLTYLPEQRFDFYGGDVLVEAARRLPNIRFDVVGAADESGRSAPANMRWHGWVEDMSEHYAQTAVVVRIPRHDGLGETVIEGLLNARHVVYTYEVPFVRRVWPATSDAVVAALGEFRDTYIAGRLGPNFAGRDYALAEFDEGRLVEHLAALIRGRTTAARGLREPAPS